MTITKIRIADRELVAAFHAAIKAGTPADAKSLCIALGRAQASNVQRSLKRAEAAGAITLDPPGVPESVAADLAANPPALPKAAGAAAAIEGVALVTIDALEASPHNPRKTFDDAELETLAASILAKGLLQAPLARPHPTKPGRYQIAAGERRRRAIADLARRGVSSPDFDPAAPFAVQIRAMSDADMIMIGIIENADRADPHPIEEAEAFLALKTLLEKEGGAAAKQATKTIAERIGKTRRHVQLRIALAENLVERARIAFAANKINLAQARALAELPAAIQAAIIDPAANGERRYSTGDNIRREAFAGGIPASIAKFKRADYLAAVEAAGGEAQTAIAKDTDGNEVYLIRPVAVDLQGKALDQIKAGIEAKGRAFVTVTDWRSAYSHPAAEAEDPADIVGAVIQYSPHDFAITVFDKVKLNDHEAKQAEAEAAKSAAEASDKQARAEAAQKAGIDHTPQPYSRKVWIDAKAKKTATLQAGVAEADPRIGAALLVIGLLESGAIGGPQCVDGETVKIATTRRTGFDNEIGKGAYLADAIAPLAEAHPSAFHVSGREVLITDAATALKALIACETLSTILAALVADRVGTWTGMLTAGGNEGPGDGPLVLALANELELEAARFEPDQSEAETYFKQFSRGTIGMLAKRVGEDPARLPNGRAEAAKALAATEAGRGYEPLEYSFAPPEITIQAVDALLHGEPFPKGKSS